MDLFNIPHQELAETVQSIHWLITNRTEIFFTIVGLVCLHFYSLYKIYEAVTKR